MNGEEVALANCDSYHGGTVSARVGKVFRLLGGPASLVPKGGSVFLKVNALLGIDPGKGVTTHPEVVRAVACQFREVTDNITIGDCPGGPALAAHIKRAYEKCGLDQVAREVKAGLCLDTSVAQVKLPSGVKIRSVSLSRQMVQSDCLVSIPKFKTHMLVGITCAVKNLFGAVPGMNKFAYHSRFSDPEAFSHLLVDVAMAAKPRFHVVDAIEVMEGDGPRAGTLRHMGLIAAGRDAFAVDTLMMYAAGLDPKCNLPLAAAMARGLAHGDLSRLNLLGADIHSARLKDFRLPGGKPASARLPRALQEFFGNLISFKPSPDPALCNGCGTCAAVCPEGAVEISDGVAVVDGKKCIRCYCCHELCEREAMTLQRSLLMRLGRMNR